MTLHGEPLPSVPFSLHQPSAPPRRFGRPRGSTTGNSTPPPCTPPRSRAIPRRADLARMARPNCRGGKGREGVVAERARAHPCRTVRRCLPLTEQEPPARAMAPAGRHRDDGGVEHARRAAQGQTVAQPRSPAATSASPVGRVGIAHLGIRPKPREGVLASVRQWTATSRSTKDETPPTTDESDLPRAKPPKCPHARPITNVTWRRAPLARWARRRGRLSVPTGRKPDE